MMAIAEYINPAWLPVLRHNRADSFEVLWQANQDGWFEPPNERRGGWSGVVRHVLELPEGGSVGIFIKRQENHSYRSGRNLFRAVATFEREFRNLQRCRALGIATPEPVYFGQRTVNGKVRAILVTRELAGYQPFDAPCYNPITQLDRQRRQRFIQAVSQTLRHMHAQHVQYNCLYLKHIFVREEADGAVDVRLIDMEKAKWRPFKRLIATRDLYSLHRRAEGWSNTDRLRLFLAYREEARLGEESKAILRAILRRMKSKRHVSA
ncbi:MAG: lipopolysaccharide kinase InaA family protein [Betaproteobacteria bacterium]|nr:lipopolysaccharide kinase InaA family protein [Betaproteobacteria bacterium]